MHDPPVTTSSAVSDRSGQASASAGRSDLDVVIVQSKPSLPKPPRKNDKTDPGTRSMLEGFLASSDWLSVLRAGIRQLSEAGLSVQDQLACIARDIAAIDELLTDQVNAILHHPVFQKLESSWRGLRYLVDQADTDRDRTVRVRVLDVSWKELTRDVQRSNSSPEHTQLFQKVYEEEFGTPGGTPFGVLIGDYQVHRRPDDIDVLESIASTAASAFAPFIAGAAPGLIGLDDHRQLERQIDLSKLCQGPEYIIWNNFRCEEDAKFVGLTLPQVLIRKPYGECGATVVRRECLGCGQNLRGAGGQRCPSCGKSFDQDLLGTFRRHRLGFRFKEEVSDLDGRDYLWANGAFAFAGVLIRTFIDHAWLADIRGFDHDGPTRGLVTGLPVDEFGLDEPGSMPKMSTQVLIDGMQEKQLADHGLIALCHGQGTPWGVYYSNSSVYKPPSDTTDTQQVVQGRVASMLQYTFCISRFAHYLKVLARDYIGSRKTAKDVEDRLNDWVNRDYVTQDDLASASVKAKCPLREAEVKVREIPDKPGQFQCQMKLWPHYQLDDLSIAVRLVTTLSGVKSG